MARAALKKLLNNCRVSLGIYKSITHVLRAISTALDHRKSQTLDRFLFRRERPDGRKGVLGAKRVN